MQSSECLLRIALVTPMLPLPHDLTRGRYIYETAVALSRIATVRVFFQLNRYPALRWLRPRSFIYEQTSGTYSIEKLDVEHFQYLSLPIVTRGLNGLLGSRALAPRVRAFDPDLLLAYWVYPDGYAALRVARSLGLPCVIGALGSDIHTTSGITRILTRKAIEGTDALIAVSEAMREAAIRDFAAAPSKVHTVVNGRNEGVFHPRPRGAGRGQLGISDDTRLVVYVGRLVESKGIMELLAAFQQMVGRNPQYRLAFIGDGVMRRQLHDTVVEANLERYVTLTGGLEPDQVAQWIAAADVLALPSWSEGFPNVVVEAVSSGRPVVATDVGGTREIVRPANGLLVPPRDVPALQRALEQALETSWDPAAIAATFHRTWDDVASETLSVCRSVMRQRRDAPGPYVSP